MLRLGHLIVWKQKEFSFRGEKVVFEDQLKSLLLKAVKVILSKNSTLLIFLTNFL